MYATAEDGNPPDSNPSFFNQEFNMTLVRTFSSEQRMDVMQSMMQMMMDRVQPVPAAK